MIRPWLRLFWLIAALPLAVHAAPRPLTLGVFLPTSLADGQERYRFGQALAERLSQSLSRPVSAKSFGRYEDYARAVNDGTLDLSMVESWVAAELSPKGEVLGRASLHGENGQRWSIVARQARSVAELKKKRLAVTRGASGMDAAFVSNVVFGGDLTASRHFTLVPVPSMESALEMVSAGSADAALIALPNGPSGTTVVYHSPRIPGPVVMAHNNDAIESRHSLLTLGAVAPFDSFAQAKGGEVADLHRLITHGPPARRPVIAESPPLPLDLEAVVDLRSFGLNLPSFAEDIDLPAEPPDD